MRALARHLLRDHGYGSLGYLGGYADSPDSIERREVLATEAAAAGATLEYGPEWQGYYFASGGAQVINQLLGRAAHCRARSCARTTRPPSVSCPRCASTASAFPARWR